MLVAGGIVEPIQLRSRFQLFPATPVWLTQSIQTRTFDFFSFGTMCRVCVHAKIQTQKKCRDRCKHNLYVVGNKNLLYARSGHVSIHLIRVAFVSTLRFGLRNFANLFFVLGNGVNHSYPCASVRCSTHLTDSPDGLLC